MHDPSVGSRCRMMAPVIQRNGSKGIDHCSGERPLCGKFLAYVKHLSLLNAQNGSHSAAHGVRARSARAGCDYQREKPQPLTGGSSATSGESGVAFLDAAARKAAQSYRTKP